MYSDKGNGFSVMSYKVLSEYMKCFVIHDKYIANALALALALAYQITVLPKGFVINHINHKTPALTATHNLFIHEEHLELESV